MMSVHEKYLYKIMFISLNLIHQNLYLSTYKEKLCLSKVHEGPKVLIETNVFALN